MPEAESPFGNFGRHKGQEADTVDLTSLESDASVRTTASEASKRAKRSRNRDRDNKRSKSRSAYEISEAELGESSQDEKNDLASAPKRETRGRPATTGKGVLSREIKVAKETLAGLNKEIEDARRIAEGDFDPRSYRANGPKELELGEEMRVLPSCDIAAELMRAGRQVADVAARSKHIKGTLVKALNEAALHIKMGTDALATRALGALPSSEREREEEVVCLRQEVRDLETKMERIREERRLMPPFPLPKPPWRWGRKHFPPLIMPPRNEWPPAIRPSIRGRRRILSDYEEETRPLGRPPLYPRTASGGRDPE